MKQFVYIIFSLSFFIIAACSGSSETNNSPEPLKGSLDIPITGLPYKTESQSGITSGDGEFHYLEGESISFYLGDTEFGQTKTNQQLAFSDLVLIPTNSNDTKAQYSASWFRTTDSPMPGPSYLYSEQELRETLGAPEPTQQLKLINELRLLWSLDEDSNPSNGITISESSRLAFDKLALSFEQLSELFANDTYNILNSLEKTLFTPSATIAVTYRSLNKPIFRDSSHESYLSFPRSFEEDTNGDGIFERRSRYDYDSYGNFTEYSLDINGDNTYDFVRQIKYQKTGQKLSVSVSRDGIPSSYDKNTYDAIGRPTKREYDSNANGTIDHIQSTTYNQINSSFITETDSGGDGTVDTRYIVQYDEFDRKIKTSYASVQQDITTSQTDYSYNENGHIEREQTDENRDGVVDLITTSSFNLEGATKRVEVDKNADGKIDTTKTFNYDNNGNILEILKDENNDGSPDCIESYTYDHADRKLTFTKDYDNGGIDYSEKFVYSSTGKMTSWVTEVFGEEANIITQSYVYDTSDLLTSFEYRSTKDTTENYTKYYEYQFGRYISRIETDNGIDKTIDSVKTQTYDTLGNITRITIDHENDGITDYSANIEWQESTQIDAYDEIIYSFLSLWLNWSATEFELLLYQKK